MRWLVAIWIVLVAILLALKLEVRVRPSSVQAQVATPTATPTPTGPPMCSITGSILQADGTPLVNGTITLNSQKIQVVNSVVINPTLVSTNTDANGNIRAVALPQGLLVQVTVCPPATGQGQSANCSAPYSAFIPFSTTANFGQLSQGTSLSPPNPVGSPPQLIGYNASNAVQAETIGGDLTLAAAGTTYNATVTKLNGVVPGGACPASQFVTSLTSSAVPSCAAPAGSSVPTGPYQTLQSNASNVSVWNTNVGIGQAPATNGALSMTMSGATLGQFPLQIHDSYNGNATIFFDNNNTGTSTQASLYLTTNSGTTSAILGINGANVAASTWQQPSQAFLFSGLANGIAEVSAGTGPIAFWVNTNQIAQWRTGGLDVSNVSTVGTDAVDVAINQNNPTTIMVKNGNAGANTQAGFGINNGVSGVNLWLNQTGPNYSAGTWQPNEGYLYADRRLAISSGTNDGSPIDIWVSNTKIAYFANDQALHIPNNNSSELFFGGGGILGSNSGDNFNIGGGGTITGSGWTTLGGTGKSNIVAGFQGAIRFYADTGLSTTVGTSFAPTQRAYIDSANNEVSWTPDLQFGGANTGITYSGRGGTCWTFGKFVACNFAVVLTSKGTATGSAQICGLPFTGNGQWWGGAVTYFYSFSTTGLSGTPNLLAGNGTCIQLGQGISTGYVAMTDAPWTASSNFQGAVYYLQQ